MILQKIKNLKKSEENQGLIDGAWLKVLMVIGAIVMVGGIGSYIKGNNDSDTEELSQEENSLTVKVS